MIDGVRAVRSDDYGSQGRIHAHAVDAGVVLLVDVEVCPPRADIGGREDESASKFALNVQIPLVSLWVHQVSGDRIDGCQWIQACGHGVQQPCGIRQTAAAVLDRKSTRLNSSHMSISYAVFCLKK